MAKKKAYLQNKTENIVEEKISDLVEVTFVQNFEGHLNNFHISQKPNTKLLVTKPVYDFLKKHKAIE